MGRRPSAPPFSTLGWSLAGALALALSLPPVGFYPLAWVGLVPLLVRWGVRTPSWAYARELYAVLLATSCCVGFWILFSPDPGTAALGGVTLFLVPVPLTAAFVLAGVVRHRVGLAAGLGSLVLYVVAAEFLVLQTSVTVPWLLLGHTQVEALDFIQIADLGGVLLLSLWVLLLNVAAFAALGRPAPGTAPAQVASEADAGPGRFSEWGVAVAAFAALVAVPVVYGAVRTAQADVPSGYTRVGVVQPGLAPRAWDAQSPADRVDYLVEISDGFLARWDGGRPAPGAPDAGGAAYGGYGLLLWPQSSLPTARSPREEQALYRQLERWASRRDVSLLAGARLPTEGASERSVRRGGGVTNAAVLVRPDARTSAYRQMRRVSFADEAGDLGDRRVLLQTDRAEIAATVGFESVFGDHVRRFAQGGADLIVVLARNDLWGRSAGLSQHLMLTRLRAVESRRSVVLSAVSGGSAVIHPSGAVTEVAGWMESEVASVEVPLYRGQTFYVRHGDWLGRLALVLSLVGTGGLVAVRRHAKKTDPRAAGRKTPAV